ncbi:chemotaxis protein CheW [Ideonella dechloratans]|uniref:Chemotaxis protein CheW n=1 Tax=Ideonella dechloratans TaxID=36863 RepID=A0A643FKG6_IDEDE|nr:chemotaxis protein CheW [Ideonella dechloratans]KAB0585425.1 chemotaxis protein CheW [Ideonella dechloratans]UFU09373.1 chemotaxis protein CheW [Ideonella dechloratans]
MSNKEALRELQVRLANRLQAARERPREAGWLAVECAGAGLLLPLGQAGEIQSLRDVTPVPHAAPWLVGVANVRGQLNAVMDLAAFLGLRERGAGTRTGQLVVFNPGLRVNSALLIDRLVGLRDSEQLQRVTDDPGPRPAFAVRQWRDGQGRVWDELDLAALVQDPLFLEVAAG